MVKKEFKSEGGTMVNIINICFSESARGTIKRAAELKIINGQKVVGLFDDFSYGPISNLVNTYERIIWADNFKDEFDCIPYCSLDDLKTAYNKFYKDINEIESQDQIYIWYGNYASEICGMMYVLELLKNKSENLYFINVSDLIHKYPAGIYIPRSAAEILPEKLGDYIKIARSVDSDEKEELLKQWKALKNESSQLRVFKEGKVISVSEDYFDVDILKWTEKELKKSARIVGSVIGYADTKISDYYIFNRIKELVKAGRLKYEGKFGIMREMEIAITEEGLNYLSNYKEAMEFWNKREKEEDIAFINDTKNQGRMEEKVELAKKLLDVLDIKIIAEKTGLTEGQIRNLN